MRSVEADTAPPALDPLTLAHQALNDGVRRGRLHYSLILRLSLTSFQSARKAPRAQCRCHYGRRLVLLLLRHHRFCVSPAPQPSPCGSQPPPHEDEDEELTQPSPPSSPRRRSHVDDEQQPSSRTDKRRKKNPEVCRIEQYLPFLVLMLP